MLSTEEDSGEAGFRSFLSRWQTLGRSSSPAGSTLNDPRDVNVGLRRRVAVISVLFLCAVGGATWYLVNLGQQRLIEIKALDRARLLSDVAKALSDQHVNILTCTSNTGTDRISKMRFDFELGDPSHLESVVSTIKRIESVYDAYRIVPGKGA